MGSETEREQEQVMERLQEIRDEHAGNAIVQEAAGMAEIALKAIYELRSERDRLVKAVEELTYYAKSLCDSMATNERDKCLDAIDAAREALEAVEGDGVEGDTTMYVDSNLKRRCECGHGLNEHGYRGCFVSDCDCDMDWMTDLPGGVRIAKEAGAEFAAPQDADDPEREHDVDDLVRSLYSLAYNMRETDFNDIEWERLDETAETLEAAARRLRRGGAGRINFSCPHCGSPNATPSPGEPIDIHSGATYECGECGGEVIFSAETPAQYTIRLRDAPSEERGDERLVEGDQTDYFDSDCVCGHELGLHPHDEGCEVCDCTAYRERPGGSGGAVDDGTVAAACEDYLRAWRRWNCEGFFPGSIKALGETRRALKCALHLRRSSPGGEGEPVAWAVVNEAGGADKLTVLRESAEIWLAEHEDEHPDRGWSIVPLYADHPAPDSEAESDE